MYMFHKKGFTLLEMVVAIGIFAVIAVISYGTLNRFIDNREVVVRKNDELRRLQTAVTLLGRDMRFIMHRPVRDGFGDIEAAFVTGNDNDLGPGELLRFTTTQPSLDGVQTQRPRRVAWRFNDGQLSRVYWTVLDRDQDSVEYERILLSNLVDVGFSFLTYDDKNELEVTQDWQNPNEIPSGIEVLITDGSGKQYRRVFETNTGI